MPVVLASQSPLDVNASYGYGAAQASQQGLSAMTGMAGHVLDVYSNRQRYGAEMAIADQRARQSGAETAYRQMSENQNLQNTFESRQSIQANSDNAEMARTQAKIEGQRMLQSEELSQKETMRLQKLKQAKGAIEEQRSSGYITDQEARDLTLQVQTGIDPLDQRRASAAIRHQEEQDKKIREDIVKQQHIEQANSEFRAKKLPDRIVDVPMEDGTTVRMYEQKPGIFAPVPKNSQTGAEKPVKPFDAAAAVKQSEAYAKGKGLEKDSPEWNKEVQDQFEKAKIDHWKKENPQIQSMTPATEADQAAAAAGGQAAGGQQQGPTVEQVKAQQRQVGANAAKTILQSVDQRFALGGTPEERSKAIKESIDALPPDVKQHVQPPFDLPGMTSPVAEGGKGAKAMAATPEQKEKLAGITKLVNLTSQLPIPDEQKTRYNSMAQELALLLSQYGSEEQMPDDKRQRYEQIKNTFRGLTMPQTPKPAPSKPAESVPLEWGAFPMY